MDFTISPYPAFTVGATVNLQAYQENRPPLGPVLTTAVVGSDGRTTFTGLAEGTRYLAGVGAGASWRGVDFTTGFDPTNPQGEFDARELATDREVIAAINGLKDELPVQVADFPLVLGETDDTARLGRALAAAAGRAVSLGGGSYVVRGVSFPSGSTVVGPGKLTVSPSTGIYPLYVAPGVHDVTLRGFEIDGNKANIPADPDEAGVPADAIGKPQAAIMVQGTLLSPCQRIYVEDVYEHDSNTLGIVFQNVQTGRVRATIRNNERDGCTLYFNCRDVDVNVIASGCGDDHVGINSVQGSDVGLCERIKVRAVITGPSDRSDHKGRGVTVRGGRGIDIDAQITDTSQAGAVLTSSGAVSVQDVTIRGQIYRSGYLGSSDKDGVRLEVGEGGGTIQGVTIDADIRGALQEGVLLRNTKATPLDDDIRDITIRGKVEGCTNNGVYVANLGINDIFIDGARIKGNGGHGVNCTLAAKRIHVHDSAIYRNVGDGVHLSTVVSGSVKGCEIYDDRTGGANTQVNGIYLNALAGTWEVSGNDSWGHTTLNYAPNNGTHTATFIGNYRVLGGSATWNPASLADGAKETKTVSVAGAEIGDPVAGVGFTSITASGWRLYGTVTATGVVTVTIVNETGGTVDLPSGTVRADVRKYLS